MAQTYKSYDFYGLSGSDNDEVRILSSLDPDVLRPRNPRRQQLPQD